MVLEQRGEGESIAALRLRNRVMQMVMLTCFEVDATFARIDAEAAHVDDSRSILEARKERRDTALNVAKFAIGGALGTAGSAMQLTRDLNHAGNVLNFTARATAFSLSIVQPGTHRDRRILLSPYNMLAEVLGQRPNAQSHNPAVVEADLRAPSAGDGQLPDNAPPEESLRNTWTRLHRLQGQDSNKGSTISSVTTDPTSREKLTSELTPTGRQCFATCMERLRYSKPNCATFSSG